MMATLGERIKLLRKEKGLKQDELGKVLGVQLNAVSGWERNLHTPESEMIEKLLEYFDVSWDYLMGIEDERDKPIVTLSDEEAAAVVEAEEREIREYILSLYYDLSPEMKKMVLSVIGNAHQIDKERGALISQQVSEE